MEDQPWGSAHFCGLAERIGKLLFDEQSSDVILVVGGQPVPAHRAILTASSEYFRALLRGHMKESFENKVVLNGVPLRGFRLLMEYVYTGQVKAKDDLDGVLELLEVAHVYGFEDLLSNISRYLSGILSTENICLIHNKANFLQLKDLNEACVQMMDQISVSIVKSETFRHLSASVLCQTLSRNTFSADEISIFQAVERWCTAQSSDWDFSEVLELIRLPLIETKHLVTTVRKSGLIESERILEAIEARENRGHRLLSRAGLKSMVNIADAEQGAKRLIERAPSFVFPSFPDSIHEVEEIQSVMTIDPRMGLLIAFVAPHIINHVTFAFVDEQPVSYFIETSLDLRDWTRVIDHSSYRCRSFQNLHFEALAVRYLRMVLARVPGNDTLRLSDFRAFHDPKKVRLSGGFYAPGENVARVALGATILERPPRYYSLLDEAGHSWIPMGLAPFTIQLAQPFALSSLRMFLCNPNMANCNFCIETSVDKERWTRVANCTLEHRGGAWRRFAFDEHPVIFIRIVASAPNQPTTLFQHFYCSQFQCPAQDPSES